MAYPVDMDILSNIRTNRTLRIYDDKEGISHPFPPMSDHDGYTVKVGDIVAYAEEYENSDNYGKSYIITNLYESSVLGEMCEMVDDSYMSEFPELEHISEICGASLISDYVPTKHEQLWKVEVI